MGLGYYRHMQKLEAMLVGFGTQFTSKLGTDIAQVMRLLARALDPLR